MYRAQLVNNEVSPSYYTIVFVNSSDGSKINVNLLKLQDAIISAGSYFTFQSQKFSIRLLIDENRVIVDDNRNVFINVIVNNISDLQNDIIRIINVS